MSNTYFKIETKDVHGAPSNYDVEMDLSLTAFVGREKLVQLTCRHEAHFRTKTDYGTGYVTLSRDQCERLIKALQERLDGKISATGVEVSAFTDDPTDDDLG